MPLFFSSPSISRQFSGHSILFYTGIWTLMLTLTVAIASFSPELAFVRVISPTSSFSRGCRKEGYVRIPLDIPGEMFCFPAHFLKKSSLDFVVPSVFAALIVAGSACVVRSVCFWEIN
ncbi:hypothetical protein ACHQM5_021468 [Ranunculus cassubicifolius]